MNNQFREVEVADNDIVTDVRLFYGIKKSEWRYLHKVVGTMIFEKKGEKCEINYL